MRYKATRESAEEIFNDAVVKIFNDSHKLLKIDNILGWCSKIIFNTTIDTLRKEVKYNERRSLDVEGELEGIAIDNILNKLEAEELLNVIKSLDTRKRTVFSLYEIDGYSHKEISQLLDVSVSNSKYILHEAKKELKQKLANWSHVTSS